MAYCVHCGVKLGGAESCCPLCGTPVIDPSDMDRTPAEKAFPPHTPEQKITISRRFLISLYTMTMLIPAVLCLVINLLLSGQVTWSAYPAGALTLLYIGALVFTLTAKYKRRTATAAAFVVVPGPVEAATVNQTVTSTLPAGGSTPSDVQFNCPSSVPSSGAGDAPTKPRAAAS